MKLALIIILGAALVSSRTELASAIKKVETASPEYLDTFSTTSQLRVHDDRNDESRSFTSLIASFTDRLQLKRLQKIELKARNKLAEAAMTELSTSDQVGIAFDHQVAKAKLEFAEACIRGQAHTKPLYTSVKRLNLEEAFKRIFASEDYKRGWSEGQKIDESILKQFFWGMRYRAFYTKANKDRKTMIETMEAVYEFPFTKRLIEDGLESPTVGYIVLATLADVKTLKQEKIRMGSTMAEGTVAHAEARETEVED